MTAFVAFIICLASIPFIPFSIGPLSAGFGFAIATDTIFKGVFLCFRFYPSGTPRRRTPSLNMHEAEAKTVE